MAMMTTSTNLSGSDTWRSTSLGELISLRRGHDLTWREQREGHVPVMGSAGQNGFHNQALAPGPGVVLGRSGASFGKAHYCETDFWPHNTALYVTDFRGHEPRFIYYLLDSIDFTRHNSGGAQQSLNRNFIASIALSVPSQSEQALIAKTLDDASDLISTIEHSIAKKQAIKQGMMQKRFGLPEDRAYRAQLGTLTTFLSGGTPDRSNAGYWSGSIPWISATTLKRIDVSTSDQSVTELAVRAGSKFAPLRSTLVLVRGSALHSEIRASLVTARVCFNQDVKALVPSARLEPKFLTYSIHANASRLLRLVTSAGNTAGVLDTKVLKNFEIWLPDIEIQREVVSVFDDVSHELEALASRLDKAKAIKQGMMQQLLTGRTRLPLQEATA